MGGICCSRLDDQDPPESPLSPSPLVTAAPRSPPPPLGPRVPTAPTNTDLDSASPTPTPTGVRRPPTTPSHVLGPLLRLSLPWSTRSRGSNPRAGGTPSTPSGPCIRIAHLTWTAPPNLTDPGALSDHRDAYWDTAPTYGGRSEIWMALRMAVDAIRDGDAELACVIAHAAELILPASGDLTCDPAYDSLGNAYTVPVYCLVDPSNLGQAALEPVTTGRPSIPVPASVVSSQDTVASAPTAPLLQHQHAASLHAHQSGQECTGLALPSPLPPPLQQTHAPPSSLGATFHMSEESLADDMVAPKPAVQPGDPPPPFPIQSNDDPKYNATGAWASSSSSSVLKSTHVPDTLVADTLNLTVRLSCGPSIRLPTARATWTVSETMVATMAKAESAVVPRVMMYLGRVLPPSLILGDIAWVPPDAPPVLQLMVVPGTQLKVPGEEDGQDEDGGRTPVVGRRKA